MSYIYETVMGTKKLVIEYCYSSLHNKIKVVEMTADGKFHRLNWMSKKGQSSLMSSLVTDYTKIMQSQQDPDYDSEIDLDRDVPKFAYGV